jgi:hypothetical protein
MKAEKAEEKEACRLRAAHPIPPTSPSSDSSLPLSSTPLSSESAHTLERTR